MEMNFDMSPLSGSDSESVSIPYSRMTEEDAQIAFSTRKEQIKAMLKGRASLKTPDSVESKYSVSSTKSKNSNPKPFPKRFTADPEKISKHGIDLPLTSQQELRERLRSYYKEPAQPEQRKYDVSEPLYKRTLEWKQNLTKQKEELKKCKNEQIFSACTFEPSIEKSEIRNMSVGIYTRNVEWKNEMNKKNEALQDLGKLKELQECSFKPKLVSSNMDFSMDFQQRSDVWQERLYKKVKKIEEEATKDQVFYPKIIKPKTATKKDKGFENRFNNFLSKLDEISEKIENSLAHSVL